MYLKNWNFPLEDLQNFAEKRIIYKFLFLIFFKENIYTTEEPEFRYINIQTLIGGT